MRKAIVLSIMCATLLLSLVYVDFASAQATRTWVSGVGDDANPCSRTAPCKTFAGAISKTATGGEINVLDPGGFGGVTITKSMTIRSDRFEAGVLVSGTNAIIVSAPDTAKVILEGLDIEGLGTGIDGVRFLAGKELHIIRSQIRNFTGNGVTASSATAGARTFIQDSYILFNGVSGNGAGGVNVTAGNVANITNTTILSNQNFSVQANGAGAIVGLQGSILNNTATSINLLSGGLASCIGPSNLITGAINGGTCGSVLFK